MNTASKLECAVDWLTATWKREDANNASIITSIIGFEQRLMRDGNTQELTQWQGYSGRKTGSFFVGERDDGYCLRVSGSTAHLAFTSIYRPTMHVSRLDVAVTVWLTHDFANVGLNALSDARYAKMGGKVKHPTAITHYESDDGGFTLYLGRRSSRAYARLYNKEVESGDIYYEGSWRYEVELHNASATETAQELLYSLFPVEEAICSAVWKYFHSKGVQPTFDNFPQGVEIVLPRREETTIERSIKWLASQVKPTVAKLVALGYTSDVLEALGLPWADRGHLD